MKKLTRRTLISLAALLPVIRVNAAVSGRFDVIVVGTPRSVSPSVQANP